jgi:RNA polymerase sigma-70 factor (ECF subfamily)
MTADTFKDEMIAALPNLRAFALAKSGRPDLADDLVQDTIVKAWANRRQYTAGTNIRAWLFTILRNTHVSNLRKSWREVADTGGRLAERLACPPEQHGRLDLVDFASAFARLSADQREALVLVTAEGFSYDEAAEITGWAVGTVKSRVNRARARLAEILDVGSIEDYGPDKAFQSVLMRPFAVS